MVLITIYNHVATNPFKAAECSDIEYQCRDGINCISDAKICDGKSDCLDGDDEEHCDSSKYCYQS